MSRYTITHETCGDWVVRCDGIPTDQFHAFCWPDAIERATTRAILGNLSAEGIWT